MGQKSYIWQRSDWTRWRWSAEDLLDLLGQARKAQGRIIAQADFIGLETQADILVEDALTTSAIEGERLNRDSVRSSVAKRLGLPTAGLVATERAVDGLVEILLDATTHFAKPLTAKRLFGWHAALFPTGYSGMQKITVGHWRRGKEPMQVVSGPMGKETVHFEAVPSASVHGEMEAFFAWWKRPPAKLDGLLRSAIAHLWFVTIHPFDDGNGRIARALTDMALAQDERTGRRLYSLCTQVHCERNGYYDILEKTQRSTSDITPWLAWFLGVFTRAIEASEHTIQKALDLVRFWQQHPQLDLNPRQRKALSRMLEAGRQGFEGGMTNRKYTSLNKTSRESAKRDLADLEKKGLLKRIGQGRSFKYELLFFTAGSTKTS